jgi:hypothetical protein
MNPNPPTDQSEERLKQAAQTYEQFLRANPAERETLDAWGSAPLLMMLRTSERQG